jgi:hypothetical protein
MESKLYTPRTPIAMRVFLKGCKMLGVKNLKFTVKIDHSRPNSLCQEVTAKPSKRGIVNIVIIRPLKEVGNLFEQPLRRLK